MVEIKNRLKSNLDEYSLHEFRDKFISLKLHVNIPNFMSIHTDLSNLFSELNHIVKRLNNDISDANRILDIWDKVVEDKKIDEVQDKELDEAEYIAYFHIDIKTLYIWFMIFMDKLPKFLILLFKRMESMPETRDYDHFYKSLKNYKGKEIEELYIILNAYYIWFKEIKDIRDDYTIHHPRISMHFLTSSKSKEYISGSIGTVRKDQPQSIPISNEKIDAQLQVFLGFIRSLNDFLCKNVEKIPFSYASIT